MNFLLCLDPSTLTENLRLHRVPIFIKIAQALIDSGHHVNVYGTYELKKEFLSFVQPINFYSASTGFQELKDQADLNNALLYVNQASIESETLTIGDMYEAGLEPDVVISTAPTATYRKIWPNKLFLHYELGIFNRHPFPIFHQFDPGGFHHKSILSKYLNFNLPINQKALVNLNETADRWLANLGIGKEKVGYWDVVYVPIPSFENWTVKSEISYKNRLDYLRSFAIQNLNTKIVCNEKPQHPLTLQEREEIKQLPNVQLIENKDFNGIGSLLAIYCKTTYTFSPSLALQTLFWGNQLITHPDSSMNAWAKSPNAREHLAGYFSIFNIQDFSEIDSRIKHWQQFNPYQ